MRKSLALVLLLALLLPALAVAEAPFSLRTGFTWGMDVEAAKALATQEGLTLTWEDEVGNTDYALSYEHTPAGDYDATLSLLFYTTAEGTLSLGHMAYAFEALPPGSSEATALEDYLQTNLTQKYGMGTTPTLRYRDAMLCWPLADTLIELMDSSLSPYGDQTVVEFAVHYTALDRVRESNDTPDYSDDF